MSAGIRALAHAAETIEPMLPRVRERLARTREGARALDHLTELHRGRPGPARAAFDRMCDRMVRRVLAAYGDEVAAHAERIERNLVALLDDLDHRRRGEAATRTARQRLADLEGLASASRQMRTLDEFVRAAAAAPEGPVLTGARHDVDDELRAALADLDVDSLNLEAAVPGARTTRTGSARVTQQDDVSRAFVDGTTSTTDPGSRPRERTVRDSERLAADRERSGRTDLQVSTTDPRLARVDLEDLPVRREDLERHLEDGRGFREAVGRARRDALRRLEQVIGTTIADAGPLRRHWEATRERLMAGRTVDQVGEAAMRELYPRAQGEFWAAVAADPDARAWLAQRGLVFEPGSRAPVVRTNGNRTLPVEELRISLDHLAEKAVGENWRRILDPDNLALVPSAPNTAREVEQARQGMRR